jgi:hypothetical protein
MLAPRCMPPLGDFGDRNSPCSAGLGEVPLPRFLIFSFGGLSGLVEADAGMLTVRSWGGRGEIGTFSRKHSSGTSSPSSSSHSFSNSFADFLSRFDCQLLLLVFSELIERLLRGVIVKFGLELRFLFIAGTEAVLGLLTPLREVGTPLCVGNNPKPSDVTLLTWPRRLGYAGRVFPAVNSLCNRLPCVVAIGTRFLCFAVVRRSLAKVAS